jgi:hypothetical protein
MGEMTSGPGGAGGGGGGGDDKNARRNLNNNFQMLIDMMFGGGKKAAIPPWASRPPVNIQELMRQLSGNAGQMPMPGGPVGAVRTQPTMPGMNRVGGQMVNPAAMNRYGQQGGEATFFQQSTRGGMTPLSALGMLGSGFRWNPFEGWRGKGGGGGNGDDDKNDDDKPNKPGGGGGTMDDGIIGGR